MVSIRGVNLENAEETLHVDMIVKAIRLSRTIVADNLYKVWFQLFGPLVGHAQRCDMTKLYTAAAERYAPRQSANPRLNSCSLRDVVPNVMPNVGPIFGVNADESEMFFLWIHYHRLIGTTEHNLWFSIRKTLQCRSEEMCTHSKARCGVFSGGTQAVVTEHLSGKVVIWRTFSQPVATVRSHQGVVFDVAFGADRS